MRIFLTGGRGMVGRNFLEHHKAQKHQIIAPTSSELDLSNMQAVNDFVCDQSIDFVVHAAGRVGGIQANIKDPVSFLVDNMDIGRNVILASRNAGIKHLLNIGSSCMYPRNAPNPLKEESILSGELEPTNEGYALAKIVATRLCEYIHKEDSSFLYKTIIPCNIYGRYDKFDPQHSHLIPAIIHKLHDAKINNKPTVAIWGTGQVRREFMYAEDLADCIWTTTSNFSDTPAVYNCGLGHDYSVTEYYEAVARVVGYTGSFTFDFDKPEGIRQKLVNIDRIQQMGWASRTTLEEGIAKTYEYYLDKIVR